MENQTIAGKQASVDGFAHEMIVAGILMKRYHNVFLNNMPLSPYDLILVCGESETMIRAQIKTASKSVSFTGGTRGGVDREYKSGVKTYTQSTKTSDIIIGLHPKDLYSFELYFVPTCLVEVIGQKSLSLSKIEFLKNNFDILENCKNKDFVIKKCTENKLFN